MLAVLCGSPSPGRPPRHTGHPVWRQAFAAASTPQPHPWFRKADAEQLHPWRPRAARSGRSRRSIRCRPWPATPRYVTIHRCPTAGFSGRRTRTASVVVYVPGVGIVRFANVSIEQPRLARLLVRLGFCLLVCLLWGLCGWQRRAFRSHRRLYFCG
jgi:hypothetical protein